MYTDYLHPYIAKDYIITALNSSITINVLANDIDYNADVVSIQSFETMSKNGGIITQVGNLLKYTPPNNFIGRDSFSYWGQSGSDGGFLTNNADVIIEVRDTCNLALHYSFDEDNGTLIKNLAWQIPSHNGKLDNNGSSSKFTSGVTGNAINLPADDAVLLNDVLDPLDKDLSVSVWFKIYELPLAGKRSIVFDSGSRGGLFNQGLSIMIDDDGLHFQAQTESIDHSGVQLDYVEELTINQWYHTVIIIDRNLNILKAYVNGLEVTTSTSNNIDFDVNSIIKGYPGYSSFDDPDRNRASTTLGVKSAQKRDKYLLNFNGAIDEFKIFTTALTGAQVEDLFNHPSDHSIGNMGCETLTNQNIDSKSRQIQVFPNPTEGIVTIKNTSLHVIKHIKIYSTLGKQVFISSPNTTSTSINLSHLSQGLYYIEINSSQEPKEIHKLIIN